jgi:hypothetical protein
VKAPSRLRNVTETFGAGGVGPRKVSLPLFTCPMSVPPRFGAMRAVEGPKIDLCSFQRLSPAAQIYLKHAIPLPPSGNQVIFAFGQYHGSPQYRSFTTASAWLDIRFGSDLKS